MLFGQAGRAVGLCYDLCFRYAQLGSLLLLSYLCCSAAADMNVRHCNCCSACAAMQHLLCLCRAAAAATHVLPCMCSTVAAVKPVPLSLPCLYHFAAAAVPVNCCCCCHIRAALRIHVHSFNICADFFGEIIILNHLFPCLCFSNLGNANKIKAISALINLLFGRMYLHWIKRISGMHSICR